LRNSQTRAAPRRLVLSPPLGAALPSIQFRNRRNATPSCDRILETIDEKVEERIAAPNRTASVCI